MRSILLGAAWAALVATPIVAQEEMIVAVPTIVYEATDTTSAVVAELRPGDRLIVWGRAGRGWLSVEVADTAGFVRADDMRMARPAPRPMGRTPADPAGLANGMAAGRLLAAGESTSGWSLGSFAGGVTFGLIGTAIGYASAGDSETRLPAIGVAQAREHGADFRIGIEQGYRDRLIERRRSAALTGGLLGSAIGAMAWYFILSN